ncbi:Ctr copper transporter [Trametopsis cervina]|nr:Ctr copper transporter [Trametopsis cervina]
MEVDMTPWLHFTSGDNLLFKSLHPSSKGAIAGACIVLVLIAVFQRWVAAMKGVLEAHWARRVLVLSSPTTKADAGPTPAATPAKEEDRANIDVKSLRSSTSEQRSLISTGRAGRRSPPFIASHDIPRGAIFAVQALLTYLLMLAVMTFQAAYIISVVVGLGIGEVLFGRMGSTRDHLLH